jgi:hypothetical protein
MIAQLQGAALSNEAQQAKENLAALTERFGNLSMEHLRRLISNGVVLFEDGGLHTPPSIKTALGRDFIEALEAAYRDTPIIASLLIGEG